MVTYLHASYDQRDINDRKENDMPKGTIIKTPTLEMLLALMLNPVKYEIVERIGLYDMEEKVNLMIAGGWKPCGGLAVRFSNRLSHHPSEDLKPIYTQAMVKEETK